MFCIFNSDFILIHSSKHEKWWWGQRKGNEFSGSWKSGRQIISDKLLIKISPQVHHTKKGFQQSSIFFLFSQSCFNFCLVRQPCFNLSACFLYACVCYGVVIGTKFLGRHVKNVSFTNCLGGFFQNWCRLGLCSQFWRWNCICKFLLFCGFPPQAALVLCFYLHMTLDLCLPYEV